MKDHAITLWKVPTYQLFLQGFWAHMIASENSYCLAKEPQENQGKLYS